MELEGPDLVACAKSIARRAHEGQTDKLGDDYIAHPQRVAEGAPFIAPTEDRFDCAAAGWLHDVIEDTSVMLQELEAAGFPSTVVKAVDLLTRREEISPLDY